ncbi:MAG TPA: SRPBCC domain-containing protein [Candidatus Sulfotelmatobacter sp.]|nr:SRPBCC domain-containing protein [Candidatus Sulfotelmatobacter sp.]
MTEAKPERQILKIEKQIELSVPPETVWKMLTDPNELTRWFPLEARITPGQGGEISLSWGPTYEGGASIEIWEPNRKIAWAETSAGLPLRVEWTIESRGGKTLLRLVQSSFASGADWESEFYDSTNYGWDFMLLNLRHYLERHPGEPRLVAWPRQKKELPRRQIYDKLLAPEGIFQSGTARNFSAGQRYSLRTATGEEWSGRVEFVVPARGFCVTVESLNDGLAWLTIEGAGPEHDAQLWFSLYGLPAARVKGIEDRWADALKKIFA